MQIQSKTALVAALSAASLLVAPRAQAQDTPLKPAGSDGNAPPAPTPTDTPSEAPGSAPPRASDQSKAETPPVSLAEREKESATAKPSWFTRAPMTLSIGEGKQRWSATIYGFVEVDAMNDSTRSYGDSEGGTTLVRNETYGGHNGRTQFTIRNTRLGFKLSSPEIGGVRPSAIIEGDFFGNQPSAPPSTSEAAYFNNPTFRIRHAYLKLENDVVDVWAGQTYYLWGWQNYFFPASVEFLGLPNELFGRTTQVRFGHTFKTDPVNVDLAIAAMRPPQRDSTTPEGNAGIRLTVNNWKAINTPGNGGTAAFPAALGVSGAVRHFKVDQFSAAPTGSEQVTGYGLSIDAMIPIIPASDSNDRGNKLTLTGSFTTSAGFGDEIAATGNAGFPTLPNPAMATPAPTYTADVDNGLVTYDSQGALHAIRWQTFMAGLQYYLPPDGRVILSVNYTQSYSSNLESLFPKSTKVWHLGRYADANIFWDVTPAVRIGGSFQYTSQEFNDGQMPRNLRAMALALYFF